MVAALIHVNPNAVDPGQGDLLSAVPLRRVPGSAQPGSHSRSLMTIWPFQAQIEPNPRNRSMWSPKPLPLKRLPRRRLTAVGCGRRDQGWAMRANPLAPKRPPGDGGQAGRRAQDLAAALAIRAVDLGRAPYPGPITSPSQARQNAPFWFRGFPSSLPRSAATGWRPTRHFRGQRARPLSGR
jgi:hypothetical protein